MLEQIGRAEYEAVTSPNAWTAPPPPSKPRELAKYKGGNHAATSGDAMHKEAKAIKQKRTITRPTGDWKSNRPTGGKPQTHAKMTDRRQAVLDAMARIGRPATATEIHRKTKFKSRGLSRETNNDLHGLSCLGRVVKVQSDSRYVAWKLVPITASGGVPKKDAIDKINSLD